MWLQIATILPLLQICRAVQVRYIKEDPQAVGYVYKNTNGANKLYYRLGSNRPVVMEYSKKVGAGKYYKSRREMMRHDKETNVVERDQHFAKMENDDAIPTKGGKTLYSQITKYISNRHTNPLKVDLTDFNLSPSSDAAKNNQKAYVDKYHIGLKFLPISDKDIKMMKSPDNYYFPFENLGNKGYEPKVFDGKDFNMLKKSKSWQPDYGINVDLNRLMQRMDLLNKQIDSELQAENDKSAKNKENKKKDEQHKSEKENQYRREHNSPGRDNGLEDTNRNAESSMKGDDYNKSNNVKKYEDFVANKKPMEFSQISDQLRHNVNNMKDGVRISRNLRPGGLSHHANASRSFLITSRSRRFNNK